MTRLQTIVGQVVTNTSVSVSAGNLQTQNTSLPAATSTEGTTLQNLVSIVIDYIADGVFTTPTTRTTPTLPSDSSYATVKADRSTIQSAKSSILTSVDNYLQAGAGLPINIEMGGNRSMLANDFAMINDLGYAIVVTNGGASEQVSTFTYYCHTHYWANNGGQIRSVAGSNAHGDYGLRASGYDVTELPDSTNLAYDMVQTAYVYKQGSIASQMTPTATTQALAIWIIGWEYIPMNNSEIEIDHSLSGGAITRYLVSTVEHTSITINGQNILKLNLSTAGTNSTATTGLAYALYDGQLITIRVTQNIKFLNIDNVKPTRPSTAVQYGDNLADIYRIIAYNLTESSGEILPANTAVLQADSTFNYYKFTTDGTNVTNADPQDPTKTQGSKVGDNKIAVLQISQQTTINQINKGIYLFGWAGRVHRVISYTVPTFIATGTVTGYSAPSGVPTLVVTNVAGTITALEAVTGTGIAPGTTVVSVSISVVSSVTTATVVLSQTATSPSGTITFGVAANGYLTIDPNPVYNNGSDGTAINALTWASTATGSASNRLVTFTVPFTTKYPAIDSFVTVANNTNTNYNGTYQVSAVGNKTQITVASTSQLLVDMIVTSTNPAASIPTSCIIQSIDSATTFTVSPAAWIPASTTISATAVATLSSVTISNAGTLYTNGAPTVTVSGGGALNQAIVTVTVLNGSINSYTIVSPGYGYTSAPTITLSYGDAVLTPVLTANPTTSVVTTAGTNTNTVTLSYPTDPGTSGNAILASTAGSSSNTSSTINSSGVLTIGTASGTIQIGQILTGSGVAKAVSINITAAAALGGTATITYATQATVPFAVNQNVTISGMTPTAFNGTWIVTSSTTTQTQFALPGTYTGSAFGTIASTTYTYITANISGSGNGSTWQTATSSGTNYAVSSTTIVGTGTSSVMLSNAANVSVGNVITFTTPTSGSALGNLVSGTTYYITGVTAATNQVTISSQPGGSTFVPGTASGVMTFYTPSFAYGSNTITITSFTSKTATTYTGGPYTAASGYLVVLACGAGTAQPGTWQHVVGNTNPLYNGYFYKTASTTTSVTLFYPNDPGTWSTSTSTTVTNEGTSSTGNTLGIGKPFSTSSAINLRLGYPAGEPGQITTRISTCRATGHDFLYIGTGSYTTTNWPTVIYGNPAQAADQSKEILEEGVGRVFYVTTDQNGVFRVGRFFTVDQGTGAVTFSASIALSNLDGLGFKRGVVVSEFSTDASMTNNASDTVSVQSAVRAFVDKRLGLDYGGSPLAVNQLIGPGFLALNGALAMKGNLNMALYNIQNLAAPTVGTDAANKTYVDNQVVAYNAISKLIDTTISTPTNGNLLVYDTGQAKWRNITLPTGDVNITFNAGLGTLTTAIQSGVISNSQISSSAAIVQSKLSMTIAGTSASYPTGSASAIQAASGLSSFNSSVFTATNGWIDIAASTSVSTGVTLSRIQYIGSGTLLGNRSSSLATPTTVTPAQVVTDGNGLTNAPFTSQGAMTVSSYGDSSFNGVTNTGGSNTYAVTPISVISAASSLVKSAADKSVDVGSLKVQSNTVLTLNTISNTLNFITPGAFTYMTAVGTTGSNTTITTYGTLNTNNGTLQANTVTTGAPATAGTITGTWQVGSASTWDVSLGTLKSITLTTGADATPGTIQGTWSLTGQSKMQATYADLAEYYEGDQDYEPGTVLVFGGDAEVTTTAINSDTRLAGVVTTNPAYVMNSEQTGIKVCLALAGRVPCKVVGRVKKGDMLTTSEIPGFACKAINPTLGAIIGKAIEDKDYVEHGVITVAVGRM